MHDGGSFMRREFPVSTTTNATRPHLGMFAMEPVRAMLEFARMRFASDEPVKSGDGHAVVFFPGLGADHRYMSALTNYCTRLGYTCFDWGRGCNTGPTGNPLSWLAELAADVAALAPRQRKGMTLVGWSLGGLYAREIAKALAHRVRQVVTLGTPFAMLSNSTNVQWLYEMLNGSAAEIDPQLARMLRTPPPVPTTSIYSRSDGVVAWKACLSEPGPFSENIEVDSSHMGLIWHPDVLRIVADRLAQRPGEWRPWQSRAAKPTSTLLELEAQGCD
jgi:pimeloyl-ACP methyl ester carboxylesterase